MNQLETLIRLSLELEGLLRSVRDRDSHEARILAKEKADNLHYAATQYFGSTETPCGYTVVQDEESDAYPTEYPAEAETYSESPAEIKEQEAEESEMPDEIEEGTKAIDNSSRLPENILRMLTINDKFRFCRELFNSRQDDFKSAMNIIAGLESYDEACDFLYNDLMWKRDDETVAEFMEIVKRAFPK